MQGLVDREQGTVDRKSGYRNVPGRKADVLRTIHIFALCVGLGLCGCNPKDAADLKQDAGKLIKTTGEAAGNAKVAGNVNLILASWKGVHLDRMRVEAKDNVVTLVGTVPTAKEKAEIERVCKQIRGVDKVINELKVEAAK